MVVGRGASIHVKRTIDAFLSGGNQITLVDHFNPYPEGRQGFRRVRPPRTGSRFYGRILPPGVTRRIDEFLTVAQLRRLWRRLRPDLAFLGFVDDQAYRCVRAGLRPLVLFAMGTDINSMLAEDANPGLKRAVSYALAQADLTIVDARQMVGNCARIAGKQIRAEVLPLGVDATRFRPGYREEALAWRKKLGIPNDAIVLLSARALASRYNHHLILEAFALAARRLKGGAALVFKEYDLHDGASYKEDLCRMAESLGVSAFIRWVSDVPFSHLHEIYAMSDIVVNFPQMDAWPVTFAEAAACQKPVITCRLPCYVGTFAERYFSMVEAGNVAKLADAMVASVVLVRDNPRSWADRLLGARVVAETEFNESRYATRLQDICTSLLAAG